MMKGFSLIEILFSLLIISVLSSIVYPSYQAHITHSRRNEAKIALLDLASRMEVQFFKDQTYAKTTLATGNASDILSSNITANSWYHLAITAQNDDFYQLEARPALAQASNDKQCQTFTLDSRGTKGLANGPLGAPTGSIQECWY